MAKILKTNISKTVIGMDNGQIEEIDTSKLNFIPQEGDIVEVFKSENDIYVNKIQKPISQTITNVYISGKPVNKIAYALLAIFLGCFGIHKFYAGKSSGIFYLLFCWTLIPGFIAFIEGIVALTRQADEQGNIYV